MPKEPIVLSLSDDDAKKLAKAISSATCQKIMDALFKGPFTETELSKRLKLPLSTVHYNMKQLKKANLVDDDEFHYSEKGREVTHYSLANRYVVITAGPVAEGLLDKLKTVIPVLGIVGLIGAGIRIFGSPPGSVTPNIIKMAAPMAEAASDNAVMKAEVELTSGAARVVAEQAASFPVGWFIGGAALAIAVYLLIEMWRNKK